MFHLFMYLMNISRKAKLCPIAVKCRWHLAAESKCVAFRTGGGGRDAADVGQSYNGVSYILIDMSTSPEFTAHTSFTHTNEHSWSLIQRQLNVCHFLPTISRNIESRKCFVEKLQYTTRSLII